MATEAETLIGKLAEMAETPAATSVDGVSVSERSLADVAGAAKELAKKTASTKSGFGVRCQKTKLGGALG